MKITHTLENKVLTFVLEGKLDSLQTPLFQQQAKSVIEAQTDDIKEVVIRLTDIVDTSINPDDTMLKVFPEGTTKEDLENVVMLTRKALLMDVPTPMTFDIQKVDGKLGLVYESVQPVPNPDAKAYGKFLRQIHSHTVTTNSQIPSAMTRVRQEIQRLSPYLGEDAVDMFRQLLTMLPDTASLLHGNISLDNIMQKDGKLMLVDMSSECYGNPLIDLSHLYFTLPQDMKEEWFSEFLEAYYDSESANFIRQSRRNILTVALIWHFCSLILFGQPTADDKERLQSDFQKYIVGNWGKVLANLSLKSVIGDEISKLESRQFFTDMNVNIDWMAETLGTNRHYISNYFNKVLNTSFSDYINKLRLDYAIVLIKRGHIPLAQIPYAVGYSNDHTFRRLFRERFGCTPYKWKTQKD